MPDISTLAPANTRDILLSRLYDAPRDAVWSAFADPKALETWWAPNGCTIQTHEADIRPGGVWAYKMTTPEGKTFENRHKYEELNHPERIVYRQGEKPEDDNAVLVTVTFAQHGAATLVTLRIEFSSNQWREKLIPMGAIRYPAQSLEHLAAYLARREHAGSALWHKGTVS